MATAEIGLNIEGLDRYDALSQQIQETFLEFHSLLDRKRILLLERVKYMKDLNFKYLDLSKALKQLEDIKSATNEILTENLIAEKKGQVVSLLDDNIANLEREKADLFPYYSIFNSCLIL
ncbi:hypothetical protein LOD99_2875 [Oopsacas minuta]|uniref:Uncharacterized protein n=1 Tax=Oopsacas minuta TaxID=111878 RepID=A0AAV7JYJ5_9METZ|nr:hypothetical protein LOD99_2875 [Oopsacas minuta]